MARSRTLRFVAVIVTGMVLSGSGCESRPWDTTGNLVVTPATVHPGDTVSITASGLGSRASVKLYVLDPAREPTADVSTGMTANVTDGAATFTWAVPSSAAAGRYTVMVADATNPQAEFESGPLTVARGGEALAVDPERSWHANTVFRVTGSGFGPSSEIEYVVYHHQDDRQMAAGSVQSDSTGSFGIDIPRYALPGNYVVYAAPVDAPREVAITGFVVPATHVLTVNIVGESTDKVTIGTFSWQEWRVGPSRVNSMGDRRSKPSQVEAGLPRE